MKIISNTSSTSIRGVTFMFAFWPPLEPIAIAIIDLLYCYCVLLSVRRCRYRRSATRRRSKRSGLLLIRQKAELIHTGRAHVVYDFDHPAKLCPGVGLEKDPFVGAVRQLILDLLRQIVRINGIGAEEDVVIASDGDLQRVLFVGVVHIRGIIDLGHVHL